MTAELLKNLIPSLTGNQTQTASSSSGKAAGDKQVKDTFAGLLDDIKSKYEKRGNKETQNSESADTEKTKQNFDTSSKTENAQSKTKDASGQTKNPDSTVTESSAEKSGAADTTVKTETMAPKTSENTNTDETPIITETKEESSDNTAEPIKAEFAAAILNNLLLTKNDNNTAEDTTMETEIVLPETESIEVSETANTPITKTSETVIANEDVQKTSAKITPEITKTINPAPAETQMTQTNKNETNTVDAEVLNDDTLVKAEEVIDQSLDDVAISDKKQINDDSKITQDIIDDLDVTVRSVEQPKEQSASGHFSEKHSNAQEEIIKMSLENSQNTVPTAETVEFSIPVKTVSPDTGNIDTLTQLSFEKTVNNTSQISSPQPQKTAGGSEILSQINNKITLPQENASSKVNIILKPENLGKVSVEILHTKDGITAKMIAETPQVKEILDKSIESLKNTISSHGVNVNNITVKVEEANSAQNSNFGFEEEQFNREASQHSNQGQNNSENSGYSDGSEFGTNTIENEPEPGANAETLSSETKHQGSVNITV